MLFCGCEGSLRQTAIFINTMFLLDLTIHYKKSK